MNNLNNLQNLCVIKHKATYSPPSSPTPFLNEQNTFPLRYVVKYSSAVSHSLKIKGYNADSIKHM